MTSATWILAVGLAACAAPKPSAPTSKPSTPASKPSPAASSVSTTPETPIPFPPGTFTGAVVATTTPVVRTDGDLLVVTFSIAGPSEVECVLSSKPVAERGALGVLAEHHRSPLLWGPTGIALAAQPLLSALFLTVNPPIDPVAVIASRDGNRSVLCTRDGAVPREAFDDTIAGLLRSLSVVPPAKPPVEVRHCAITATPSGSVGYETTEVLDLAGGGKLVRASGTVAFQNSPSVDLLEFEHRQESDARGRIVAASFAKAWNGGRVMRSQLTRSGSGYRAEVISELNGGSTFSGEVEVTDPEGLPSAVTIMRRIKDELLSGRARELVVEIFDPLESERKTTRMTYRLDDPVARRLTRHAGSNVEVSIVDAEGNTLSSELRLRNSALVQHTCGP